MLYVLLQENVLQKSCIFYKDLSPHISWYTSIAPALEIHFTTHLTFLDGKELQSIWEGKPQMAWPSDIYTDSLPTHKEYNYLQKKFLPGHKCSIKLKCIYRFFLCWYPAPNVYLHVFYLFLKCIFPHKVSRLMSESIGSWVYCTSGLCSWSVILKTNLVFGILDYRQSPQT
jgi:hypothetical protein